MRKFYNQFYPNINTRVTLPFLLVIAVVAGFGVFTVIRLVAGSTQERLINQLVDSAQSAKSTIVEVETQTLEVLRFSVFTSGLADAVAARREVEIDILIRPIVTNAALDEVIIFDATGANIYQLRRQLTLTGESYQAPPVSSTIQEWTSVQRILNQQADLLGDKWIDIIDTENGKTFYIGAPITNADNQVVGGMLIGILGTNLSRQVSLQALSFVTLYDLQGQVLGTTLRADADLSLSPEAVPVLLAAAENSAPLEIISLGDVSYQRLYATLEMRDQTIGLIAVSLQNNFITDRAGTSRNIFAGIFAVMFVAVLAIGVVVARSITRPVYRLVATTRAIREGDLSQRVALQIPDELGELSESFDHMTSQLIARNEEINQLYIAQLEETAQREAVLSSIRDIVIVMSPEGRMLMQNPSALDLIRTLRKQSQAYRQFVDLCLSPQALRDPRNVTLLDRHYSVLATPVVVAEGDVLGYVIVFRDITDLIEAERIKDEMTLQLSHELRTPLTAIAGYIGLAQTQQTNPNGSAYIQRALDQVDVLNDMIQQVIEVSNILTKNLTLDVEQVDLVQIIHEAANDIMPKAEARGIRASLSLTMASLHLWGDAERLRQVMHHLMQNAYSYTLPGGAFEVSLEADGAYARVYVVDSGVGIDENEMELVFDRLYRGRSADAGPTDARGLGLGLYLSREIVQAHGGHIELESEAGIGTVVTVSLPIHRNQSLQNNNQI